MSTIAKIFVVLLGLVALGSGESRAILLYLGFLWYLNTRPLPRQQKKKDKEPGAKFWGPLIVRGLKTFFFIIFVLILGAIALNFEGEASYISTTFLLFFLINRWGTNVEETKAPLISGKEGAPFSRYSISWITFLILIVTSIVSSLSALVLTAYLYLSSRSQRMQSLLFEAKKGFSSVIFKSASLKEAIVLILMYTIISDVFRNISYSYYSSRPEAAVGGMVFLLVIVFFERLAQAKEASLETPEIEVPQQVVVGNKTEGEDSQERELIENKDSLPTLAQSAISEESTPKEISRKLPPPEPYAKPEKSIPKISLAHKFMDFVRENVVTLLLLLGTGFIFTGAITFLRSNWQEYKLLVFWSFVLLTLSCFGAGYYYTWWKKDRPKLAFALLLLASLFFPLNFHFAVKVGLIISQGNHYVVLWLTSALMIFHAWLLSSTVFTLVASATICLSHEATLKKFYPYQYDIYPLFLVAQAYCFLIVSFFLPSKDAKQKILVFMSNLTKLVALFALISFWDIEIACITMGCATLFYALQIWRLSDYSSSTVFAWLGAFCSILFVGICADLAGLPTLWQGFPLLLLSFVAAYYFLPEEKKWVPEHIREPLFLVYFSSGVYVFALYLFWGAYTTSSDHLPLIANSLLAAGGYFFLNRKLKEQISSYLVLFFLTVALWGVGQMLSLSQFTQAIVFLFWGLSLAYLAHQSRVEISFWQKPAHYFSQAIVPLVLFSLAIFFREYYQENFGLLTLSLFISSAFYLFCSYLLKRQDMLFAGIALLLSLCFLYTQKMEIAFHYTSLGALSLSVVLLYGSQNYSNKLFFLQAKTLDLFTIPIVLAFSLLSFWSGLFEADVLTKLALVLSFAFFGLRFYHHKSFLSAGACLLYLSLESILVLSPQITVFPYWGIFFLGLSILLLACQKKLPLEANEVITFYAKITLAASFVLLLFFYRFLYFVSSSGLVYTLLLALLSLILIEKKRRDRDIYLFFSFAYLHLFFLLPQGLFPFQYGLFFIPVAIALLYFSYTYSKHFSTRPCFYWGQATVLFFLFLPGAFPGIVPPPQVAVWVIACAFAFYLMGLRFYQRSFYSYASGILFLACLLVGLFAYGKLWGNQIALIVAIANFALAAAGYGLIRKKLSELAFPFFHLALLCVFGLIGSVLLQGKIDYPTLFTVLTCSLLAGTLAYLNIAKLFLSRQSLAYLCVALFALSYYLILERISLEPGYEGPISMILAFISLGLALLLRKIGYFSQAFLYVAVLSPILSLSQTQSSGNLAIMMLSTSLLYGVGGSLFRDSFLLFLSFASINVGAHALLSFLQLDLWCFFLLAVAMGMIMIYIAEKILLPKEETAYAHQPMVKVAYLSHLAFLAIYLVNSHVNVFLLAGLTFTASVYYAVLFRQKIPYFALALVNFLFSYYIVIYSWSENVVIWEFYTIPIGFLIIAWGLYLQKDEQKSSFSQDFTLLGLILIMLPTFIQSYYGWFSHLQDQGVSPYRHLYHSIFLSIESLVVLFCAIYARQLTLFLGSLAFLISDALLMIFTYVNFGTIPQAVWWGSLGTILIVSAWAMEYRRDTLVRGKDFLLSKKRKWIHEMKSWN